MPGDGALPGWRSFVLCEKKEEAEGGECQIFVQNDCQWFAISA